MSERVQTESAIVQTETNLGEFSAKEIRLIQWEEWALSMEEHFHATEMFERNPTGLPMGHR